MATRRLSRVLLFISLPRVYKLGTIDLKRELKALAPRREKHRPKAARGGRHVQPDDGVTEEVDHGDGEEQDVELM